MAYSPYCLTGQARLGWRLRNRLCGGLELGLLQGQLATKQWTAATEVRLRDGHVGTKTVTTIAVELGFPDCVIVVPARANFPALWTRKRRAQNFAEIGAQAATLHHISSKSTSGQSSGRQTHRSAVAQDYLSRLAKKGSSGSVELLVGARLRVGRRILKAIGGDSQTLVN